METRKVGTCMDVVVSKYELYIFVCIQKHSLKLV